MKSINKFKLFTGVAMLGLTFAMSSCVRKDFDAPPDNSMYDPQIPVTTTIAQMRGMLALPTSTTVFPDTTFTQDMVISGIVTADDRSGNYYKQIVIQDETGGIAININNYSLYTHYPVGRKLYVKLKGMTLSYDGSLPVLGLGLTEQRAVKGLESSDIDAHIIRGNIGNVVKDTVITLATAKAGNPYFFNRLVTISDSLQFADTIRAYTDPTGTTNRYLTQCGSSNYVGNTTPAGMIAMRSSNFANFHALQLPRGKGIITGILTTFGTTAQLVIRDTADVKFNGPRCGAGGGTGPINPGTGALITIDSMRKLYPGTGTTTLGSYKITGVIISDIDNKNFSSGNFIIEDNSRKGAIIYISGSTAYKVGDSVVADLTGATLKLFSGALEIDNMTAAKVTKIASNKTIDPLPLTITQLNANFAQYESTLIKITNGTVSGGSTYGASNLMLNDGSGSIQLYTTTSALFAGQAVATTPKTYVGIPTPFNTTKELKLRNPATDVY